ncbi:ANK-REP-REGION domain-containing protein [Mycena kentingensis (nom. inval.)]|nr:ANK-REP-REGION domain-containing protein [Mycena kentingensis (nom. inval.)]
MSFGIGIGDIALLSSFAWRMYKSIKTSSKDFLELQGDIKDLHNAIHEAHDFLKEEGDNLEAHRRERFGELILACIEPLKEFEKVYLRYEDLPTQAQRTWDRVHFALQREKLANLRERMRRSTTQLQGSLNLAHGRSTMFINKKLMKLLTEVHAGLRNGSVVSNSASISSIHTPEGWKELCRELEDVGLEPDILETRQEYVVAWLREALPEGQLEEGGEIVGLPGEGGDNKDEDEARSDAGSDGGSDGEHAEDDDDESAKDPGSPQHPHSPSSTSLKRALAGNNSSGSSTLLNRTFNESVSSLTNASSAFRLEMHKHQAEFSKAPKRPPPVVRMRRATDVVGLVRKLLQKPTDIIQAASDNDIERVARLISLGMSVNARDRWGWSALSMCGYGGYPDIARMLLEHGADPDNVDVDEDTPMSLAHKRGHASVVAVLEEWEEKKRQKEVQSLSAAAAAAAKGLKS